MVNFNLRELSAPVEALRSDVQDAYKRVDSQWREIVRALEELLIPCPVVHVVSDDANGNREITLEWRKFNRKYRICIVRYDRFDTEEIEDVTPFEEWSGVQRVAMLEHVPQLFHRAAEDTKEFVNKTLN